MPLYEYLCGSCGHRFERIQKFSDAPIRECPMCGGAVEKQISSPAIQFKGAGWYITDYAKAGGADKKKSDSKAGSSSDSQKAETKSDSTSDASAKADKPAAPASTTSTSTDKKT